MLKRVGIENEAVNDGYRGSFMAKEINPRAQGQGVDKDRAYDGAYANRQRQQNRDSRKLRHRSAICLFTAQEAAEKIYEPSTLANCATRPAAHNILLAVPDF
jgi:hypothetical protein